MFCIFRILHIHIPRVFFFSPSWNCSVENQTFLKVWLQLLLHSPAVQKIFIHLSLYLSFPQPFKPSDWYFQLWSQTAKWTLSLTEIEKARCFSHGKLKPSWIPGLTCNDPNHSRHPVGQYACCWLPEISSWVEKKPECMPNSVRWHPPLWLIIIKNKTKKYPANLNWLPFQFIR